MLYILLLFIIVIKCETHKQTIQLISRKSQNQTLQMIWDNNPDTMFVNWSYGNVSIYIN